MRSYVVEATDNQGVQALGEIDTSHHYDIPCDSRACRGARGEQGTESKTNFRAEPGSVKKTATLAIRLVSRCLKYFSPIINTMTVDEIALLNQVHGDVIRTVTFTPPAAANIVTMTEAQAQSKVNPGFGHLRLADYFVIVYCVIWILGETNLELKYDLQAFNSHS